MGLLIDGAWVPQTLSHHSSLHTTILHRYNITFIFSMKRTTPIKLTPPKSLPLLIVDTATLSYAANCNIPLNTDNRTKDCFASPKKPPMTTLTSVTQLPTGYTISEVRTSGISCHTTRRKWCIYLCLCCVSRGGSVFIKWEVWWMCFAVGRGDLHCQDWFERLFGREEWVLDK